MAGILYSAFIITGSLVQVPDINTPFQFDYTDKVIHFFMYFFLVGWFSPLYPTWPRQLLIVLGAITLGFTLEFLQGMTDYRSFDLWDESANSLGAISALLISRYTFQSLWKKLVILLN